MVPVPTTEDVHEYKHSSDNAIGCQGAAVAISGSTLFLVQYTCTPSAVRRCAM